MAGVIDAPDKPTIAARIGRGLLRWSLVIGLFVLWEALVRSGAFTPFMLPSPESVMQRIWSDAVSGDLFINMGLTLYRSLTGFAIAAALGILIGMFMTQNAGVRWFFDPIISVAFPMPKITFLPVIVLWLGFYDTAKISMVVFDAIFPVITGTIVGMQAVEKELLWSARNMGAKERELLWQVMLPAASPQIMTGLQVALPIAVIVATVAEMLMGGYGIGGAMSQASRMADSRGVFAGIVEIAVVGWFLVKGMSLARRRLLVWHPEADVPSGV
jgi:ABC-type nitrate/sulfonate/bicarbonate transport system permease component